MRERPIIQFTPEQEREIAFRIFEARISEAQLYREKCAQLERQLQALARHVGIPLERA